MNTYPSPTPRYGQRSWQQCTLKRAVLAVVTLLAFMPSLLYAEQEGDFTYSIKDGAVTISKYTGAGDKVTIPEKMGGLPVRTIDPQVFSGMNKLTSVKIPSSVTSHELWGFQAYDPLVSITVDPANPAYHSVDGVLFDRKGTTLLKYPSKKLGKHYDIPEGVIRIGLAAFNGAAELTSVTIPRSVTDIEANNFGGYKSLVSVTFEGNAPKVEGTMFYLTPESLAVRHYKGATGFTKDIYPWEKMNNMLEIDPATEFISWISHDGKSIKANFVKLDGEAVVVRKEDGKEYTIPFNRLSPVSIAQAKKLGTLNR